VTSTSATPEPLVSHGALDVTGSTDIGGPLSIGCSIALSPDCSGAPLLFCIPGGTYRRSYWHPSNPALGDYSFALALARRGCAVVTIDILGVGDSTVPPDGSAITVGAAAAANAAALNAALVGLGDGTLGGVGAFEPAGVLLVGHSLGGMLVIAQQAFEPLAAGVAVLGWSNERIERHGAPLDTYSVEDGYVTVPRSGRRDLFFLRDVPEPVVRENEVDMLAPVPLPLFESTVTPQVVATQAAQLTVPVFLLFGEHDNAPNPDGEVAGYPRAPDVTYVRLAGSAHCHNFAGSRAVLWDRLAWWAHGISARSEGGAD
jgi:pimeloyl-ACP methyl ester carboxylesterase